MAQTKRQKQISALKRMIAFDNNAENISMSACMRKGRIDDLRCKLGLKQHFVCPKCKSVSGTASVGTRGVCGTITVSEWEELK